jgi:hypothetical protein
MGTFNTSGEHLERSCRLESPRSLVARALCTGILTAIGVDPDAFRQADQGWTGASPDRPALPATAVLRHEHEHCRHRVRHSCGSVPTARSDGADQPINEIWLADTRNPCG